MVKVLPSLLSVDFLNLKEELPICSYTFGAESND